MSLRPLQLWFSSCALLLDVLHLLRMDRVDVHAIVVGPVLAWRWSVTELLLIAREGLRRGRLTYGTLLVLVQLLLLTLVVVLRRWLLLLLP